MLTLTLTMNPDILAEVAQLDAGRRPGLVVGFAAETDDVVSHATAKRARKGCDWVVANDVSAGTGIMGGSENAVTLITQDGAETWERASKDAVARQLAARMLRRWAHDAKGFGAVHRDSGSRDRAAQLRDGAAWRRLRANSPEVRETGLLLAPGARALVPTGLRVALPEGHEWQIRPDRPRAKTGFGLVNGVGPSMRTASLG